MITEDSPPLECALKIVEPEKEIKVALALRQNLWCSGEAEGPAPQREPMGLCLSAWGCLSGPMQYSRLTLAKVLMVPVGYA